MRWEPWISITRSLQQSQSIAGHRTSQVSDVPGSPHSTSSPHRQPYVDHQISDPDGDSHSVYQPAVYTPGHVYNFLWKIFINQIFNYYNSYFTSRNLKIPRLYPIFKLILIINKQFNFILCVIIIIHIYHIINFRLAYLIQYINFHMGADTIGVVIRNLNKF